MNGWLREPPEFQRWLVLERWRERRQEMLRLSAGRQRPVDGALLMTGLLGGFVALAVWGSVVFALPAATAGLAALALWLNLPMGGGDGQQPTGRVIPLTSRRAKPRRSSGPGMRRSVAVLRGTPRPR